MTKILHYLITSKLLLSNVRFSASFRRLEESTQFHTLETICTVSQNSVCNRSFMSKVLSFLNSTSYYYYYCYYYIIMLNYNTTQYTTHRQHCMCAIDNYLVLKSRNNRCKIFENLLTCGNLTFDVDILLPLQQFLRDMGYFSVIRALF